MANGYERRRDLETKAIAMADSAFALSGAKLVVEATAPGDLFKDPGNNAAITFHCRLVEGYYAFLLAADSETTGMWQVPPGDGGAIDPHPAASGTTNPANGAPQAIGAALQALLKTLPQNGSVTQSAAQLALKAALAGTGIPGPLTNAILSLVPVAVNDWSQLLPVLQTGFAQLSAPATN